MARRVKDVIKRIVAFVLAFVMALDATSYMLYAETNEDGYVIKVVDDNGVSLEGAKIKYQIKVNGEEKLDSWQEVTTAEEGVCILEISQYEADILDENTTVTINYEVTKEGYETVSAEGIAVTEVVSVLEVKLQKSGYRINVKDVSGVSLTDVTIKYQIKVNGEEKLDSWQEVTSAEESVCIPEISQYEADVLDENTTVTISYEVTKEGYETVSVEEIVVTETVSVLEVKMQKCGYRINVKDISGASLTGTTIKYQIKVNDEEKYDDWQEVTTSEDGAVILDLKEYETDILDPNTEVTILYNATKDGYETVIGEEAVITKMVDVLEIKLHRKGYTIAVKDIEGNAISEALIQYQIYVNDQERLNGWQEVTTSEDGVVTIELNEYENDILDENTIVTISYNVTKTGYKTDVVETEIITKLVNAQTTTLQKNVYSIKVQDVSGNAIQGATVLYTIKNNNEEVCKTEVPSCDNGIAIVDLAEYESLIVSGLITIDFTISKQEYISVIESNVVPQKLLNSPKVVELEKEVYIINVKDINEAPIEAATVDYEIVQNDKVIASGKGLKTDEAGYVVIDIWDRVREHQHSLAGGELRIEVEVEKEGYYSESKTSTITAVYDSLEITLKALCTVSVISESNAGVVKVNGQLEKSFSFMQGDVINIDVEPNCVSGEYKGYIKYLSIDGKCIDVEKYSSYSGQLKITETTKIYAEFAREYEVAVDIFGEGTVYINDNEVKNGESIFIDEAENNILMNVVPKNAGDMLYQLKSIRIDDELLDNSGTYNITIVKGLKIHVEFERLYAVKVDAMTNNGSVKIDGVYDYVQAIKGSEVVVNITPDTGYWISGIAIKGSDVNAEETNIDIEKDRCYIEGRDGNAVFTISELQDSINIKVSFTKIESVNGYDSIINIIPDNDGIKYNNGNTLICVQDTKLTIVPDDEYADIRIKYSGDDEYSGWSKKISIDSTKLIDAIQVKSEVEQIRKECNNISIFIDAMPPDIVQVYQDPFHGLKGSNFYNNDFIVKYKASDDVALSKFEYSVMIEDNVIDSNTIMISDTTCEPVTEYEKEIVAKVSRPTNGIVKIRVKVTDLTGVSNEYEHQYNFSNITPKIGIELNGTVNYGAKDRHYSKVSPVITIYDSFNTFNDEKIKECIVITKYGPDGEEKILNNDCLVDNPEPLIDGTGYTIKIKDLQDGKYELKILYSNKAGLVTSSTSDEFIVDGNGPEEYSIEMTNRDPWKNILSSLTFGIWADYDVEVTATANDYVSGLASIHYYKSNKKDGFLSKEELDELFLANEFTSEKVNVKANDTFVVYARIADNAGNVVYIYTNGIIVDKIGADVTLTIRNDIIQGDIAKGFYNEHVKIDVVVNDSMMDKGISGINSIRYVVRSNGSVTQEGDLCIYDQKKDQYTLSESGELYFDVDTHLAIKFVDTIIVDANLNNSDNVEVEIIAVDNAGNMSESESAKISFAVCTDQPQVSVVYKEKANRIVGSHGYYDNARTAVVTVKDRAIAFDRDAATKAIIMSGLGENKEPVKFDDIVWKSEGDEHTATIIFSQEAQYSFNVSKYTNMGGKTSDEPKFTGSTPKSFTIDKTAPTGTVSINDNTWDELLSILSFGLYSDIGVDIIEKHNDNISPVDVFYYIDYNPQKMLTKEDLDMKDFTVFNGLKVGSNKQFVVYLKMMDYAGNYVYVSSDGYIVDSKESRVIVYPVTEQKIYTDDVDVMIQVIDSEPYSGIKTIEYWVTRNGVETQRQTLFTFDYLKYEDGKMNNLGKLVVTDWATGQEVKTVQDNCLLTKDMLRSQWNGNITVDAQKNDSSNVIVYVKTVDNANNEMTQKLNLDIDVSRPEITVTYQDECSSQNGNYFNGERVATVVIKENAKHFNKDLASAGIKITAMNFKDELITEIDTSKMIGVWKEFIPEGGTTDDASYMTTITYTADAKYTFSIEYTDQAGWKNIGIDTGNSVAPFNFTIDRGIPFGTLVSSTAEGRVDSWDDLRKELTFGIWSKNQIDITYTADDFISPIKSVQYYKSADNSAKDKEFLDAVGNWEVAEKLTLNSDQQVVVYLKITDMAGNVAYISTDGLIIDGNSPRVEGIAPKVTFSPEQPINGIYNDDVEVDIKVQEPLVGGTYSGVKRVSYKVYNMGAETQRGELYYHNSTTPKNDELKSSWEGSITVDSKLNNSNDVTIEVFVEDNALNSDSSSEHIKIDTTKPTVTVEYNDVPNYGTFYNQARVATIVVQERNFDSKDFAVNITNTDGIIPVVSTWKPRVGNGNQDNDTYISTITFEADGDYTFDIAYVDMAGNKCDQVSFAPGTKNPNEFTIDTTKPQIAVSYNNNSVANGRYFKDGRVATVTIKEHNFDVGKVNFLQTASLNGNAIETPNVEWSSDGDTHVARFVYDTDGDYTFDVNMSDMAGNENVKVDYGVSAATREFTIDTTINALSIVGVENGMAYKEVVVPSVSFADINYDNYTVKLTRTRMSELSKDVTSEFITNINIAEQGGSITSDKLDIVQSNDGIYTLYVSISDKAGNVDQKTITFTLNRFGSVYAYNDYLYSLINNGGAYIQSVEEDIVITEYNADRLLSDSLNIEITKDGKPIREPKYSLTTEINDKVSVGQSGWYQYGYVVSKDNFSEDGVYKMFISSKDATGNTPENTAYDKQQILFRVDTTAPEITSVVGLDKEIVNATEVKVRYNVYDTMGLKSVKVYVNEGLVGNEITDFAEDNNNYSGEFVLKESENAQNVRIVVEDMAGNITDTASDKFVSAYEYNSTVLVSTNLLVRWYADKPLFWSSIIGTLVIIGSSIVLVLFIKRKKKNA